jgi:hypothetical protein
VLKYLETRCDLKPASEAIVRLHSEQQQSARVVQIMPEPARFSTLDVDLKTSRPPDNQNDLDNKDSLTEPKVWDPETKPVEDVDNQHSVKSSRITPSSLAKTSIQKGKIPPKKRMVPRIATISTQ